jgi:hypothetical protein
VVEIRGEDLGMDQVIELRLVGGVGRTDLAAVMTDGAGHFAAAAQIPADAQVGTYTIQAVTASGVTIESVVRLAGAPITEGGGARRGQDEGLPALQPMRSEPPAAVPIASSVVSLSPVTGATDTVSPDVDLVPFVALAGAVGAVGLLVWRGRRPPVSATGSADSR